MAPSLLLTCTLTLAIPNRSHGQAATDWQAEPITLAAFTESNGSQKNKAESRNLITNGDFENGMSGWTARAWAKKGTATVDGDERRDGHPSLRIDNPEADNTFVHQLVAVKPGTWYRLSGWIRTRRIDVQQGEGNAGATLWAESGWHATQFLKHAWEWTHVKLDFNSATKTEVDVGPRLGQWGGILIGTAWYSQVSLVELPPGEVEKNARPAGRGHGWSRPSF